MDTYSRNMSKGSTMDDEQSASRMMDEEMPAEEPKQAGWVVDDVRIRQAKNGGWIVTCARHQATPSKDGLGQYQTNDYTFASLAEAVPFIEQEFGESAEGSQGAAVPVPDRPTV